MSPDQEADSKVPRQTLLTGLSLQLFPTIGGEYNRWY